MERRSRGFLNTAGLVMASILGMGAGAAAGSTPAPAAPPRPRGRSRSKDTFHTFRHPARTMDKLLGEVAMAGPGPRYIEMPRLAAKRERQLWRAVKRGRVSQIERKLSALTGQPLWTPPAR